MKKIHLIQIAALLVLCCAMLGCEKDNPSTPTIKYGSIYGTVTDFATGDPVSNVNVRLNPRGETTLTGSDGSFQYNDVTDGRYSLSLSKNGYLDLDDDYVIEIENGNNVRRDVQLSQEFESFIITVNGVEVDTINPSTTILITNNGTVAISVHGSTTGPLSLWNLPGYYGVYFQGAHLEPNQGYPIEVVKKEIYAGYSYVYFNSSQVSKTLVVR